MSEKPLAARCVVPAIACKALSVREESRVKCSLGPRDRCRLPHPCPPHNGRAAERGWEPHPAGSPPAGRRDSKGCCGEGLHPCAQPRISRTADVLPKTATPGQERWWVWEGKSWVSPLEHEGLKSVCLGCFIVSQLLARCYSSYFSRLAYTCCALEAVPAPSRCFSLERGNLHALGEGAAQAQRAGVCDPPTLMVPLVFLKLHPRIHTTCGLTEKSTLELIAPSSTFHLLKVNEYLAGNRAGGACL